MQALFKDGDQLVTQEGFTERRPRDNQAWGQVRMLNVGGLTIFLIRGLPIYGPLPTPLQQQKPTTRTLRLAWHGIIAEHLSKTTFIIPAKATRRSPIECIRPLFWV